MGYGEQGRHVQILRGVDDMILELANGTRTSGRGRNKLPLETGALQNMVM